MPVPQLSIQARASRAAAGNDHSVGHYITCRVRYDWCWWGLERVREWQYWTQNKLEILRGYFPAFNRASTRSEERIYIDLMAGQPGNRNKETGEEFDGSARLALAADPSFTRLAFCEHEPHATALRQDLTQRFPGRKFTVYPGDCNVKIDEVLRDLRPYSWAPTFVFVDQQAAEVRWQTLQKAAHFRRPPRKSELWILASPAMIAKGVAGTNAEAFAERVDALYGNRDWRRIQDARQSGVISPEQYRDEMVNLLRWQLESSLGYRATARIPMRLPTGMPLYDMVFATDHAVGEKIMTHLYRKAAERQPAMLDEARKIAAKKRQEKSGRMTLFDVDPAPIPLDMLTWEPTSAWDPAERCWW